MLDTISIIISVLALACSVFVGYKQVKISQLQADMQDKVELYLLTDTITRKDISGVNPDKTMFALFIRNIGGNVVYLENYLFNGKEYPLNSQVLPPISAFDGFRFIYLPEDGTSHVSVEINFRDWRNRPWKAKGFVDLTPSGNWEVTYTPCEKR